MQHKVRFNTKQEAKQFVATLALGSLETNANIYKGHREFVVQYDEPVDIAVDVDPVDLRND